MTDFNKEFDLLQQWLNYRIDWLISFKTFGLKFNIDLMGMPKGYSVKELLRLYQEQGIMFYDGSDDKRSLVNKPLSFDDWKDYSGIGVTQYYYEGPLKSLI